MQKKIVFALNSITITRCLTRIGEFVDNCTEDIVNLRKEKDLKEPGCW